MIFLKTAVLSKSGCSWNCVKLACFLAVSLLTQSLSALAQNTGADAETLQKGERLLRRHCANCHATGIKSESAHPVALPFRNISRKYPVESLAEALAEGIFTGHPDMPVFYFEADEVDQIIAYLKSIQSQ